FSGVTKRRSGRCCRQRFSHRGIEVSEHDGGSGVIGCTRPQSLRSKVDLRSPEKRTEKYQKKYRCVGVGLPICHQKSASRSHQTLPRSDNRLFNLQGVSRQRKGREKQRGKNFSRLVQLTIFRTGAECW